MKAKEIFTEPQAAVMTEIADISTATANTVFVINETDQPIQIDIDVSPEADMSVTFPVTGSPFTLSAGDATAQKVVKTLTDVVGSLRVTITPDMAATSGDVTVYLTSRRTGG